MFGIADLIKAQSRIAIMINVIFSSEAMMSESCINGARNPEERTDTHNHEAGMRWGSLTTVTQNLSVFIGTKHWEGLLVSVGGVLGSQPPTINSWKALQFLISAHISHLFVNTHIHSQGKLCCPF